MNPIKFQSRYIVIIAQSKNHGSMSISRNVRREAIDTRARITSISMLSSSFALKAATLTRIPFDILYNLGENWESSRLSHRVVTCSHHFSPEYPKRIRKNERWKALWMMIYRRRGDSRMRTKREEGAFGRKVFGGKLHKVQSILWRFFSSAIHGRVSYTRAH